MSSQSMHLSDILGCTQGVLMGSDTAFRGVAIDTRRCEAGNLFVAVQGEARDGHAFIEDARVREAAAALVSRPSSVDLPQVMVPDTRKALAEFAACWRRKLSMPVVGITGSNGKTTVKQMTAAILGQRGDVLATVGNLNNDLGVPMTLLELREQHAFAVIEMGANHVGEIAQLAALAQPDVAVVTNAGDAHLEGFGSYEGIARAKGELFAALAKDGTAVINRDDRWFDLWKALCPAQRQITFGMQAGADSADVSAGDVDCGIAGSHFVLHTSQGHAEIKLPMPGRHNVMNALAASAAALAVGASLDDCVHGLAGAANVGGRMQVQTRSDGLCVIDDSYNANPTSFRAAFEWLVSLGKPAWVVMGDMAELGVDARAGHAEVGAAAKDFGVQRLLTYGSLSDAAAEAFGNGADHYTDIDALRTDLRMQLPADAVVLVKGSRRARMERVVEALLAPQEEVA